MDQPAVKELRQHSWCFCGLEIFELFELCLDGGKCLRKICGDGRVIDAGNGATSGCHRTRLAAGRANGVLVFGAPAIMKPESPGPAARLVGGDVWAAVGPE